MPTKPNADGYYRITFTFSGKVYSVRSKSEKNAKKKAIEKQKQLEAGLITDRIKVKKWMYEYMEVYKRHKVSDLTYRKTMRLMERYILPSIGDLQIGKVAPIDLQKLVNQHAGMSTSHVSKLVVSIRSMFRQAYRDRLIPYDPSAGIIMPASTSGTHRALTAQERTAIIDIAQTHAMGLWVLYMLYTGSRPSETLTATWDDIDIKRQIITIHSIKTGYGDRIVPCPPALLSRLIQCDPKNGKLFHFNSYYAIYAAWQRFCHDLDVYMGAQTYRGKIVPGTSVIARDLTPYCMRHTYATDLQSAGVPINVAKDLLGHATINTTSKIYTHLSDQAFAAAADRIAAFDVAIRSGKISHFSG